jgi:hypothetical protein
MSNGDKDLHIRIRELRLDLSSLSLNSDPNDYPEADKKKYIVQFKKPLTREERARLIAKYDLALRYYVPNYSYLEILDSNKLKNLSNEELIHSFVLYGSKFKHSEYILQSINEIEKSGRNEGIKVVVILFPIDDLSKVVENISKICKIEKTSGGSRFGDFPRLGVRLFSVSEFTQLLEME